MVSSPYQANHGFSHPLTGVAFFIEFSAFTPILCNSVIIEC